MSRTLNALQLCERALRMVDEFPLTETAADGEALRESLFWLDLLLAELAGVRKTMFLIPETIPLTLEAGVQSYKLSEKLGASFPSDGIQFPMSAWLEDSSGNRYDVEIVSRHTRENKEDPDQTGTPCEVYIDRLSSPTLYIYPTLPATETETYTIKLVVQTFAPDVSPSGVTGTQPSGSTLHTWRSAWQRYLIYRLARDIGSGPVVKLPERSLKRFQDEAKMAEDQLAAYENREHDTEPPIVEAWAK